MNENISIATMPILALRGLVVFPEQTVHFEVGRVKSVLALEEAMKRDQRKLLLRIFASIVAADDVLHCLVRRGVIHQLAVILGKHPITSLPIVAHKEAVL